MASITNPNPAAQTALGKFYLHPWDSQVLVDWAKSLVQQGWEEEELLVLSEMDHASREEILDQFDTVTILNDIHVNFGELAAITAYLEDLSERVLADEIEPAAAFAQVRPLAYDLDGIQLSGLNKLDEDLNLIDSGEKPFHHPALIEANRNIFIRTFFREMKILPPLPDPQTSAGESPMDDAERALMKYLENTVLVTVIALVVLYVFLVILGFK
jgi:hypothetical protein